MTENQERLSVVKDIVSFARPIAEMEKDIKSYPWDYNGKEVVLTAEDISNVIEMYKSGKITEGDLERWANLIESREDIEYNRECSDAIEQAIFILANPEINGQISYEVLENIRLSLR